MIVLIKWFMYLFWLFIFLILIDIFDSKKIITHLLKINYFLWRHVLVQYLILTPFFALFHFLCLQKNLREKNRKIIRTKNYLILMFVYFFELFSHISKQNESIYFCYHFTRPNFFSIFLERHSLIFCLD